ncbi:Aldehyde/histidinol dehydrogenase [Halenospora varia]|nr:Aldehyde/histidinol dehydrogenase [Halenospora varia]
MEQHTNIGPAPSYTVLDSKAITMSGPSIQAFDPEEEEFLAKKDKVNEFSAHLKSIRTELTEQLATYQSYSATEDEFERIFECLGALDEIREYLTRRTKLVAVFFPLNMPLYALCLYGLIPALVADQVYIRPPQRMTKLIQTLLPLLQVDRFFSNVSVALMGREEFVQTYITQADVTLFTGKLSNAQHVLSQTKRNSLFLFNGWGCNPIVLGEDADLEHAATKTIDARLFCSGQDCAAPDTILVHRYQVSTFVKYLKQQLSGIKIGDYRDPQVRVGKLADHGQIQVISSLLLKLNDYIVYGGCIDYHSSIIHPTIIVAPLSERVNYQELFSPVFIISVYDNDAQLAEYFEQPKYIENDMYVTLFGKSSHVQTLKKSIILQDQVVFDTDRGNDEFGGYSMGASFVSANRKIVPKPVLVPRDIYEFLDPEGSHQNLTPGLQKKIGKRVSQAMSDIFLGNLVFGFVFGSIADGNATRSSDINTFVVLKERQPDQVQQYLSWIGDYHLQMKLCMKGDQPVEIITAEELEGFVTALKESEQENVGSGTKSRHQDVRITALLGAQRGVTGDKNLAVHYRHVLQSSSKDSEIRENCRIMISVL